MNQRYVIPIWCEPSMVGKFLRRLPMQYLLKRRIFMGDTTAVEDVKEFGTLKALKDYIRWNSPGEEWEYALWDNVEGEWIAHSKADWKNKLGVTVCDDGTGKTDEYLDPTRA